ncbi:MAG: hypothetical protein WEB60_10155 [Terrimicrobiaceae bacterium]
MSENPTSPKSIWPIFVVGIVALALFLIGAVALLSFSGPVPNEDAARSAERAKAYADLQAENKKQLETFAWADKAKGTVQIPIDLAIQLTLPKLQSQQPTPAGPLVAPAPAAPAVPEATSDTSTATEPATPSASPETASPGATVTP